MTLTIIFFYIFISVVILHQVKMINTTLETS